MPATDAFLEAFRSISSREIVNLVTISLTKPTARTLYLATGVLEQPVDGHPWIPVVTGVGPTSAPGSYLTADANLCTSRVTIGTGPEIGAGETFADVMAGWQLDDSATVQLARLLNGQHVFEYFTGRVLSWDADTGSVTLFLRQRNDWNRRIVPRYVTRQEFPNAPEHSIGAALGVIYGAISDVTYRTPWPERPTAVHLPANPSLDTAVMKLRGGRIGVPAVIVDSGRGDGSPNNPKAKVLVAGHRCHRVADFDQGFGFFLYAGDRLHAVQPADSANIINNAQEAGLFLPDDEGLAWAHIRPAEVRIVTNQAEQPRAILDPWNDASYAGLDYSAGDRRVVARFENMEDLGEFVDLFTVYGYESPSNTNLTCRMRNISVDPSIYYVDASIAAAASPTVNYFDWNVVGWGGIAPNTPWAFSEIEVEFGWPESAPVVTGSGTARLYFVGFVVQFKPRQEVLEAERRVEVTRYRPVTRRSRDFRKPDSEGDTWMQPYTVVKVEPAVTELIGKFFGTVAGLEDNGLGSYTGVANALIERPADIARHLLEVYGGDSSVDSSSAFGGFVAARALMADEDGVDMKLALQLLDPDDVGRALAWIGASSASWVYLDRFTDTWKIVPWGRANEPDVYPLKVRPSHVDGGAEGITIGELPTSRIGTAYRINYGWDGAGKRFLHEVAAGPARSNSGHSYFNLRDQRLEVVANVSDVFEAQYPEPVGTSLPFVLIPGAYDFDTIIAELRRINQVPLHGLLWSFGFGGIVTPYNRQIMFYESSTPGTPKKVNLTPGVRTMTAHAQHIEDQLNLASATPDWSVTRDPTTGILTYAKPSTGFTFDFNLWTTTEQENNAAALLGLRPITYSGVSGASSQASDFGPQFGRLAISVAASVLLRFRTGGFGALSAFRRTCAEVLGFYEQRDVTGTWFLADSPKGLLEQQLAGVEADVGPKPETTIDGRAIYETNTARELLKRVAQLGGKRKVYRFGWEAAPDLERGREIEFSDEWDEAKPFPSGGDGSGPSWAGRRAIVVETHQHDGPATTRTDVVAVESRSAYDYQPIVAEIPLQDAALFAWKDARNASNPQCYAAKIDKQGQDGYADNGVQVSASTGASGGRGLGAICSDLLGGSFVAYIDGSSGNDQVYVKRLNSSGSLAGGWSGGVQLSSASSSIFAVRAIEDGAGGVYVAWVEGSASVGQLKLARLDQAGTRPSGWASNKNVMNEGGYGVDGSNKQLNLVLEPFVGGVFVQYFASGGERRHYVARYQDDGSVPAGSWGTSGVLVHSALGSNVADPGGLCPDGLGGVLIAGNFYGTGKVYRRSSTGAVPAGWTSDGVAFGTVGVYEIRTVGDVANAAIIVVWELSDVLRAQKMRAADGAELWFAGGVVISSKIGIQGHRATSDGIAGIVVAYAADGTNGIEIFAARVDLTGFLFWTDVLLCDAADTQNQLEMIGDGLGGAFVAWEDDRNASQDIYMQHVDGNGTIATTTNAEPVCTASGTQSEISLNR